MEKTMINQKDVEQACVAATEALENDFNLHWVRKSSVVRRAYYEGLYLGLRGIASKEVEFAPVFSNFIEYPFYNDDDFFPETNIGKTFESLSEGLRKQDANVSQVLEEVIPNLRAQMNESEQLLHSKLEEVNQSLTNLISFSKEQPVSRQEFLHKLIQLLGGLEFHLRFIALLERDPLWGEEIM